MPKKKTSKSKRPPKRRGHYCHVCGRHRANEKFSGKGHAAHICKDCAKEQRADAKRKHRGLPPIPKEESVELEYENWSFSDWDGEFDELEETNYFAGNWDSLLQSTHQSEDRAALRQFKRLSFYAARLATRLTVVSEIRRITLFGTLANPPVRKSHPTSERLRNEGVRVFVSPKEVQLALTLSSMECVGDIRSIRKRFIADMVKGGNKVTPEMMQLYFFSPEPFRCLGRLCDFKRCSPEREREACKTEGCGNPPFAKPVSELSLEPDAFDKRNCQVLFERRR